MEKTIDETKKPIPPTTREIGTSLNSDNNDNNIAQNSEKVKENSVNWRVHLTSQETKSIFDEYVKEPTVHFGFLVEQGVNFIVAKAGEGKSYLCMSAAIQIAKENPDMMVFYIDMDNPDWVAKVRGIPEILAENTLENLKYIVRNPVIMDKVKEVFKSAGVWERFAEEYKTNKALAWIRAIRDTTKEEKKVVLVFDSLQRFLDYNDQPTIAETFEEMEKLKSKGFTFLMIHHKNKAGEQKGLQLLNDNADQFIYIKDVRKNDDNEIVEQTLDLDKARAGNNSVVHIKYTDLLSFTTMNDVEYTKDETLVLQVAISALKKQDKLSQSDLVNAITSKIAIGDKKIRRILNKFIGQLFEVETGARGAKLYSLKQSSKVLAFFEEGKYAGVKKSLLDTCIALQQAGEELSDPIRIDISGKTIQYDTLNTIRNNILSMKAEEAEEILEILAVRYQD